MKKCSLFIFLIFCFFQSCRESNPQETSVPDSSVHVDNNTMVLATSSDLLWLQGTWVSEDKSTLETWAVQGDSLSGNVYSASAKRITEVLSIKKVNGVWVYSAQVMDQNQGKVIPFSLSENTSNSITFSNPNHDFPNHLKYTLVNDSIVQIKISDNQGKALEYNVMKLD